MRIKWKDSGWRKRFALFPIYLSDGPNKQMVWLEWVWKRSDGFITHVRLTEPSEPEAEPISQSQNLVP